MKSEAWQVPREVDVVLCYLGLAARLQVWRKTDWSMTLANTRPLARDARVLCSWPRAR
jgi:hypothetical protein